MKKIAIKTFLILSVAILTTLFAYQFKNTENSVLIKEKKDEKIPTYHISGLKDKRLEINYLLTYKMTNKNSQQCTSFDYTTDKKKSLLREFSIPIEDENYSITIPIILKSNDECNYQFIGLSMISKRTNDDDKYSKHTLLLDRPYNDLTVYFGHKGGMSSEPSPEMPTRLIAENKKYFRVAQNTSYSCRTKWSEADNVTNKEVDSFYCVMKIDSGDINFYPRLLNGVEAFGVVTNPQFGVDEITNTNLTINFIADDNHSVKYFNNGTKIYEFTDKL